MPRLVNKVTGVVINVDDELAAGLDSNWGTGESAEPVAVPEGAPTSEWTVAQMKAHASANGVDLGGATKKDDILAVLTAATGS